MGNNLGNGETFLSKGTLEAPTEIGGMRSGGSFAYPMAFAPTFIPSSWVHNRHSEKTRGDVSLNLGSNNQDDGTTKNTDKMFQPGDLFKPSAPLFKFDKNGRMILPEAKAKNVPFSKESIIEVDT